MSAYIEAIEYFLPMDTLTNEQLIGDFPEWSVEKIEEKTGISCRHIAASNECSSDLGVLAAEKLFQQCDVRREEIDYLIFCTQSPDYFLPATACLIQNRLSLTTSTGAIDINQGCSGFIYGLGLAKGLIESGQGKSILLITAETYSKFIHCGDKSVRTLFGDAGAATLISKTPCKDSLIGPFVYGTDGRGANNLIVPEGGLRYPRSSEEIVETDSQGNTRTRQNLYMNGAEVFNFTLETVPRSVNTLLERADKSLEDIDLFVFHQANLFMLEHLRRKIKIPVEKFYVSLREFGNTVSCTIPIALANARDEGVLHPGNLVMLVGFGVGYSWGATLVQWQPIN